MEEGRRMAATKGTPQRRSDIAVTGEYLHYVLDLWARQWRQRHTRGDVIVVRYADDSVVGFRKKSQAQQFLVQLQERFARFGWAFHAIRPLSPPTSGHLFHGHPAGQSERSDAGLHC